ncbi:MAG: type III PLP-dependent enzyme [Alphaproteobacteria bacterium]|nr:type III PLP-dependent enzyme [Alphaproteobacteria bacterium]
MSAKIRRFLVRRQPETPCLVVDLDVVRQNYEALNKALPLATIYYAMKANPAAEILRLLVALGSSFDTASIYEIEQVLAAGAPAERISFGNTIKKQVDIARAFSCGVRLYAFDSEAELDKLAAVAPGSRVFCRIVMSGEGADWPIGRKFGCEVDMARDLLVRAAGLGLDPYGVSFHIGSQQRDLGQWDIAIGKTAMLFSALNDAGITLKMVNLGGGFPARYKTEAPSAERHARAIMNAVTRHFGNDMPNLLVEPGRFMVGDAGIIQSEVVLVSRKGYDDDVRWVYLDIGKFGGLIETMDEAIKYRVRTQRDAGPKSQVIIAGPTCDEADVLYKRAAYELPVDLKAGDKVEFLAAGAYTSTYCSVGFNGLPPLKTYCI